jgi:hypothetical protein
MAISIIVGIGLALLVICVWVIVTTIKYKPSKTIAHKWNLGFSQSDHRIYLELGLNKSLTKITLSPASQINLAFPAESIRRSRLFNALLQIKKRHLVKDSGLE